MTCGERCTWQRPVCCFGCSGWMMRVWPCSYVRSYAAPTPRMASTTPCAIIHAFSQSASPHLFYRRWGSLELERGGRGPVEAQRILTEGATLFPRDHFLLQRWGSLEAKLGHSDQARTLFQRSAEIQPHAPTYVAWAILEEKESLLVSAHTAFVDKSFRNCF